MIILLICALLSLQPQLQEALLVKSYQPNSVIVVASDAQAYVMNAAKDLQYHIKKSSGVELQIINDAETKKIPSNFHRIYVGKSNGTTFLNKETAKLEFEEFFICTEGDNLYFLANDNPDAPAIHYAVCEWLEKTLNAKWLWPGDLGTVVDKKADISLGNWNYKWKSPYDVRNFHLLGLQKDENVLLWLTRHRLHNRRTFSNQSNMRGWESTYGKQYPEIIARQPKAAGSATIASRYQKFNLQSPKLVELIYQDWVKKGSPDVYSLIPNDGFGFDYLLLPDEDPVEVFRGQVSLTKPYLEFYQRVEDYFKKRGNVPRFEILAYSAYRYYPEDMDFKGSNFNIFFVDVDTAYTNWDKWEATGADMYLRHNWWHRLSFAPYTPYENQANFFIHAKKGNLKGFFYDGISHQWSLQGINYYMLARLSYRDMTADAVAKEYASGFGRASDQVYRYLQTTMQYAQNYNADSLHAKLNQMKGKDREKKYQSIDVLPYMYPNSVLNSFKKILETDGKQRLDEITKERLRWLLTGLEMTIKINDYIDKTYGTKPAGNVALTNNLVHELEILENQYPYAITASRVYKYMRNGYEYSGLEKQEKKK